MALALHLAWLSLMLALPAAGPAAGGEPASRPNFLFIVTDDQSPFDLKAYRPESPLDTPHLDRLAREGMVFEGAYQMGAFVSGVCTPSRHMIKCGRTLWHLPIAPEADRRCPPDMEQNTIAAVFNRAGYKTMRTGKPGNSYEAAKQMFTVRRDCRGRSGTEPEGSAWHGHQVLDYLEERAAAGDRDPFLIYFGFSHPHDPRNGTEELLAKYGAVNHADPSSLPPASPRQPGLPPNYLPAHPFATTLLPDQRDETRVSGVWANRDERTIRNETGRYFACCEGIDVQVGRVLNKLETIGELDNTYVFFTSDNGIAIGRHGLQGKQNLYQHSWRVPFVVKGPLVKPGSRVEGNVYLLDVLATLCDLAGIPAPETNEGVSFKPVLEGSKTAIREVLYGVHCGGTKPGIRCVKQGDWKLIKYDGDQGAVHQTQLFNLAENPYELLEQHHDPAVIALTGVRPAKHQVNLAGDPRHAGKLAEMESLLLAEMRRLHDPWRLWNQPDDGLTPPLEAAPAPKAGAGDFSDLVLEVGQAPQRGELDPALDGVLAAQVSVQAVARRKALLIEAGRREKIPFSPSPTAKFPRVMCRLLDAPDDPAALAYLPRGMVYRGKDNTFGKCMLARIYYQFGQRLPPELREAIRDEATSYDGFLSGGTENHVAMRRIAGLLFGEAFPNDRFHYDLKGAELAAVCRDYARAYGRAVFHNSMVEFLSPGYHAVNTSGWINLAELAIDDESRLLGRAVLDWMMVDLALNWHSGQIVPPLARDKGFQTGLPQLSYPRQQAQWNAWLYFGGGTIPEDERALSTREFTDNLGSGFNLVHAVSGWTPHPAVRNLGAKRVAAPWMLWQSRSNWSVIEPSQLNQYGKTRLGHDAPPNPRYVLRSVYADRDYALGAGYRPASIMDPIVRHATTFACVWRSPRPYNSLNVVHPYWYTARKDEETGRPLGGEDRSGLSPFVQMVHWKNAAIVLADVPKLDPHKGPLGIGSPLEISERTPECVQAIHVYVPKELDEQAQTPEAWFFREGDVYLAVRPLRPAAHWEDGRHEGVRRLAVPGGLTGVVIEVGDRRQYGSFEQFQRRVSEARLDLSQLDSRKQVAYRSSGGHELELRFNGEDWLPLAAVDKTPLDYARWPICASPYVNSRNGVLDVNDGREGFTIDWSGPLPRYAYYRIAGGQRTVTRREWLDGGKLRVEEVAGP